MMDFQIMRWLMNKEIPGQTGNNHPTTAATGVYPTSDGFINLAAMGTEMFVRLVKALGRPDIAEDARFKDIKTRGQNRPALNELIAERTKEKPIGSMSLTKRVCLAATSRTLKRRWKTRRWCIWEWPRSCNTLSSVKLVW
jgi:crotonobetainyl-CoA:carnitine CoA-transferase CaiB-like acyl-CoA transferase